MWDGMARRVGGQRRFAEPILAIKGQEKVDMSLLHHNWNRNGQHSNTENVPSYSAAATRLPLLRPSHLRGARHLAQKIEVVHGKGPARKEGEGRR